MSRERVDAQVPNCSTCQTRPVSPAPPNRPSAPSPKPTLDPSKRDCLPQEVSSSRNPRRASMCGEGDRQPASSKRKKIPTKQHACLGKSLTDFRCSTSTELRDGTCAPRKAEEPKLSVKVRLPAACPLAVSAGESGGGEPEGKQGKLAQSTLLQRAMGTRPVSWGRTLSGTR